MKARKAFIGILSAVLLSSSFEFSIPAQAANYSASETKQVKKFQNTYHKLDTKANYDQNTLYLVPPNYINPFNPGILRPDYIKTSMSFINYYRSLFDLPVETNNKLDNQNAQLGAASLGALNAKTSLSAHGLLGYKRPNYISKKDWEIAENSTLGNINFLESTTGATAGEVVGDLLQDRDNIAGSGNTGHRALILSARATRMGIGAAYGKNNGKLYSVENGMFADDILRKPVKTAVTYPASGVFPYELVDSETPWSIYLANKKISRIPKVYITDLTIGKKYQAKHVRNYGSDYYGMGYQAAITFMPDSKMKLVNTHKYRVQVNGVYTYSFRFFRQNSTLKTSHKKIIKKTSKHVKRSRR